MADIDPKILERAKAWTGQDYDEDTRNEIQALIDAGDAQELTDRFYKDLEFGTGGLRGIMGAGDNRMNVYTVRKATQGFAEYIKKNARGIPSVVVGHDCRLRSREFALEVARVMAGNSVRAYVYDGPRPTPQISFATRKLRASAAIMVTASHNPREYNGYKAYWGDGAQVVPPHDRGIISEVEKIEEASQVKRLGHRAAEEMGFLQEIGSEVDEAYFQEVFALSRYQDEIREAAKGYRVLYTPLHGVGAVSVPKALKQWGFEQVAVVPEQKEPDGSFPTVPAPNPENEEAMALALEQAERDNVDLVVATDADGDRVGVGVRDRDGKWSLLNGNQIACLLLDHTLQGLKKAEAMPRKPLAITTIVTSPLFKDITESYGVEFRETLTGFKWISNIIRECEKEDTGHTYVFGAEESFGYMPGPYVRDKDGTSSTCLAAELACLCRTEGKSLLDRLDALYEQHGYYSEGLQNFFFEGKAGQDTISAIMEGLRASPPETLAGRRVERIDDVKLSRSWRGGEEIPLVLPQSNVLIYHLEGGGRLAARPSGTEPKIKFYGSVRVPVGEGGLEAARTEADGVLKALQAEVDGWVAKYGG